MMLRIEATPTERSELAFSHEVISRASDTLRTDGALVLDQVINPDLVRQARTVFVEKYSHYLDGREHDDALSVGDRRLMITIEIAAPFDSPELYANPCVLSVLKAAFQDDFVLGGYGVVCSLPGSKQQHRHRDGGILFPQSGLDRLLPLAAVTVAIPMLEMNEVNGTTAIWLGSHRNSDHRLIPETEGAEQPVIPEGSCLIWDYRLIHGGTPNRSAAPRPLLYLTYCRRWFLDYLNFEKQPLLKISADLIATLSDEHRHLLSRATVHWLPTLS